MVSAVLHPSQMAFLAMLVAPHSPYHQSLTRWVEVSNKCSFEACKLVLTEGNADIIQEKRSASVRIQEDIALVQLIILIHIHMSERVTTKYLSHSYLGTI